MPLQDQTIREPDAQGPAFARDPNHPKTPYQFTSDELRVLRECNQESFYQRCLPLAGLLGGSVYYAVRAGYLRGHPRFGASPKVAIGVLIGYFVGKFSYQNRCAEKFMQLPNSQVGEILRQKRSGFVKESSEGMFGSGLGLAPFDNISESDVYSDSQPKSKSSLDLDFHRPEFSGLDDGQRPSLDNNVVVYEEEEMPAQSHQTTSYEELRNLNRLEFKDKRLSSYRDSSAATKQDSSSSTVGTRETEPGVPKQVNKYGDSWAT